MKRVVWAWPAGIIGNALLFTVFLGGVFHTPQNLDLYGQAGRQVMFLLVSVYGWWKWSQAKKKIQEPAGTDPNRSIFTEPHEDKAAVQPHWATTRQRIGLCVAGIVGTVGFALIFEAIGSWGPWADAWIFTGSILATYGMARGWTEFWLIWMAVDIVGIATDHCVRATAQDAVDAGCETRVLVELTAAVSAQNLNEVLETLEDAGVDIIRD